MSLWKMSIKKAWSLKCLRFLFIYMLKGELSLIPSLETPSHFVSLIGKDEINKGRLRVIFQIWPSGFCNQPG